MNDGATPDGSQERLTAWLSDYRRPERPHREGRKLGAVLAIASVCALVAAILAILNPPPAPDPSTIAVVLVSDPLATPGVCSVVIRMPTGETSTLRPFTCVSRGDVLITSPTPRGVLEAKRIHRAALFVAPLFNAAIWFLIALPPAGLAVFAHSRWQRRRRPYSVSTSG